MLHLYKLKLFVSNVFQSTCLCMHIMKKQKVNSLSITWSKMGKDTHRLKRSIYCSRRL